MTKTAQEAYVHGFMAKCAEYGVDGRELLKLAQEAEPEFNFMGQDLFGAAKDIKETPYSPESVEDLIRRDMLIKRLTGEYAGAVGTAVATGGLGSLIQWPIAKSLHGRAVRKMPKKIEDIMKSQGGSAQYFAKVLNGLSSKDRMALIQAMDTGEVDSRFADKLEKSTDPVRKYRVKNLIKYYLSKRK